MSSLVRRHANSVSDVDPKLLQWDGNNGFLFRQAEPRRLWDHVEEAVTFWRQAGQPNYDRFGVTATTEQYVWYDHPNSQHRWPLPLGNPAG